MGVVWKSKVSFNTYLNPFYMEKITDWEVTEFVSSMKVVVENSVRTEVYGYGFRTDEYDYLRFGHVTKILQFEDGKLIDSITGIDLSVKEAIAALNNANENLPPYMEKTLAGGDKLIGGTVDDYLCGYGGNDWLSGRRGDDFLEGGKGADVFVFSEGFGEDTIRDFTAKGKGHDRIDLSGLPEIKDFADLMANHFGQGPNGLHIEAGDDMLRLENDIVQLRRSMLGSDDFIFAG